MEEVEDARKVSITIAALNHLATGGKGCPEEVTTCTRQLRTPISSPPPRRCTARLQRGCLKRKRDSSASMDKIELPELPNPSPSLLPKIYCLPGGHQRIDKHTKAVKVTRSTQLPPSETHNPRPPIIEAVKSYKMPRNWSTSSCASPLTSPLLYFDDRLTLDLNFRIVGKDRDNKVWS